MIIITRSIFTVLSSWLRAIARVHSVHLINAAKHWVPANPQTKPTDLGCESATSISTITIYYYYYLARKLILILLSHWGWKVNLGTAGRIQHSPRPRLHIAVVFVVNALPVAWFELGFSHTAARYATAKQLW